MPAGFPTIDSMVGQQFGLVTVIGISPMRDLGNGDRRRLCVIRCICGNVTEVRAASARAGLSCGCIKKAIIKAGANFKHGDSRKGREAPEYFIYKNMMNRCFRSEDRRYNYYGGRGITVCEKWRSSYEAFLKDVGRRPSPKHSIDRIDNDGNYEPGNIRWATKSEQGRNRRPFKKKKT